MMANDLEEKHKRGEYWDESSWLFPVFIRDPLVVRENKNKTEQRWGRPRQATHVPE